MERPQMQLVLDVEPKEWELDEETRAVGREGVAAARAAMQAARRRAQAA
jgi:hypothetical protein